MRPSAVNVPFRATNDSEFPIYFLTSTCFIHSLSFSGRRDAVQRVKLTSDSVVHKLGSRETTSIMHHTGSIERPEGESVTGGDITFTVEFTPQIRFWKRITVPVDLKGVLLKTGNLGGTTRR